MACEFPPEITEDELSAILDGEPSSKVLEHLARCASCAARVQEARRMESRLKNILYRHTCPVPSVLRDYHAELLSSQEALAVKQHIDSCPRCRADLDVLAAFLADELDSGLDAERKPLRQHNKSRKPRLLDRLNQAIERMIPVAPQVAFRGAETRRDEIAPQMFQLGDVTVFVEITRAEQGWEVTGQIAATPEIHAVWSGGVVELQQGDTVRPVAIAAGDGSFRFVLTDSQAFTLVFSAPNGQKMMIERIELSDE